MLKEGISEPKKKLEGDTRPCKYSYLYQMVFLKAERKGSPSVPADIQNWMPWIEQMEFPEVSNHHREELSPTVLVGRTGGAGTHERTDAVSLPGSEPTVVIVRINKVPKLPKLILSAFVSGSNTVQRR